MQVRAGDLRIKQKFTLPLTGCRGVVVDIRQVVDHDNDGPTLTHAPRVLIVGPSGVRMRTLHPDVLVTLTK